MSCPFARVFRAAGVAVFLLPQSLARPIGVVFPGVPNSGAQSWLLGSARPFGVLTASGLSNKGKSIVYGDVGTVGDRISGFPPGKVFAGSIHIGDPLSLDAQLAAFTAFDRLTKMKSLPIAEAIQGNLGGVRLFP